jgi:glycine cleavage system H protein
MKFPANLRYTKDHEWALAQGSTVTIGVTDHAQSALGDIVFVDLPAVGRALKDGETFGVVESIKAVSDLYSPVSGKVTEVNSALAEHPSWVNESPYEKAWMLKLEAPAGALEKLMDAAAYAKYVESLK